MSCMTDQDGTRGQTAHANRATQYGQFGPAGATCVYALGALGVFTRGSAACGGVHAAGGVPAERPPRRSQRAARRRVRGHRRVLRRRIAGHAGAMRWLVLRCRGGSTRECIARGGGQGPTECQLGGSSDGACVRGVRVRRSEALRACCATAGQPRGRGAPTPPVQVSSDLDSRPCAYHVRGEAQAPTWTARAHGRRRRATCDERHADGEALVRAMSCRLNVRRARNGGGLWADRVEQAG